MRLITNYHELRLAFTELNICKYSIQVIPEVSVTGKVLGALVRAKRDELKEKVGFFVDFAQCLYARTVVDPFSKDVEYDGVDYTVTFKFSKIIEEEDPETVTFYSIFFKNMMRKL